MTRRIAVFAMLLTAQACQSRESKIANDLSRQATSQEQQRLWQQAADQKQTPGLTNLAQGNQPVHVRQFATAANQAVPPQGTGSLASNVTSALRIITTAGLQDGEFNGSATVRDINATGERLVLDLGNNRSLTLQARIDKKPLALQLNAGVTVDYRVQNDESARRQIFALSGPNGVAVARITETGSMPIAVAVPMLFLEAKQSLPAPGRGRGVLQAVVNVRVGQDQQTLTNGQTKQVGGMTVTVLGSRSPTGTPVDNLIEGGRYSLELIVWR